jgi:hypothetical protein
MRYSIIIIIILLLPNCIFTSCDKVIDIDLNDAEKKYVIEGFITDQAGQCQVTITETKNFDEDNNFPLVSGASVSITDNNTGIVTTLAEESPGMYKHASLAGVNGKTYTLHVRINGDDFTASSTMPQLVNMDTIYTTTENFFNEEIKLANIEYDDPAGVRNYYKFVRYRNGIKTKQTFINDDDLTDGRHTTTQLFVDDNETEEDKLENGDTVKIDMLCIDAAVHKYWFSLEQSATGETQSAAPANPVTNLKGGALGYFSAHTCQSKVMVVQ